MINCHKEVNKYQDKKVRLRENDREEMREHRRKNQERLVTGLTKKEKPTPIANIKQGSYAMHTMTQHSDKDYDIDDGAVFDRDDLKGSKGGDMLPRVARDMVRDALDDGSFTTAPEVKKNCVRVHYQAGYHVDIPVYREYQDEHGDTILELASSEWRESDPRLLTDWFKAAVIEKSPDSTDGRQMRRIVCLFKKFARSRKTWNLPSGLILSVLVDENYSSVDGRDDEAFYNTLQAIHNRLTWNKQVYNPVDGDEELTKGAADTKISNLIDRLNWCLGRLEDVKFSGCDKNEAMRRWNNIFNTDYFSDFIEEKKSSNSSANRVKSVAGAIAATSPSQWCVDR